MNVWVMRVRVDQFIVSMGMRMRLAGRVFWRVGVLVMIVVGVQMIVLQWLMVMLVLVTFGQMQPHPEAHQNRCQTTSETHDIAQERDGNNCADEWSS